MGAFKLESNLAVILLIILVVLAGVYFFLDMRKLKLTVENLDKNNEMIIKEIDNVHLQMHKFFSNMPRSIIPASKDYKSSTNMDNPTVDDPIPANEEASQEQSLNQEGKEIEKDDTSSSNEDINDSKTINIQETPRISQDQFENLKKSSQNNNNIFGEIEDFESSNDIMKEEINTDISELLQNTDTIELPPLVPVKYDNDSDNNSDNNSVDDEANSDSDDDEVNSSGEEESDKVEITSKDPAHNDKIQEYKKMSVKELKEKCMELNLKHSGNKSTLAKRIIDNL